jgi:thiamine-monophosphate kinase
MSGPDPAAPDEFGQIAALFRPLTRGAPEALALLDDAAVIPSRPGFDLVVTKDALVEGVHFLASDPPDLIARKLLRVNLSDLAAKGARPYGYFLATAWPKSFDWPQRQAFAEGLRVDGETYDLTLLGGDTTSTPGAMTLSVTMLGWVPAGRMVKRGGAQPGDLVLVSGTIGDGGLAWRAARGEIADPDGAHLARYRLPVPRVDLRERLLAHAHAAADVSDGLIADAGHIAQASGLGLRLDLDRMPLSARTAGWLAGQADRGQGLLSLASLGDDYEIVCTAAPEDAKALGLTVIGEITARGLEVQAGGAPVVAGSGGWRHG